MNKSDAYFRRLDQAFTYPITGRCPLCDDLGWVLFGTLNTPLQKRPCDCPAGKKETTP